MLWKDRLLSSLNPEFSDLWLALDPDGLLSTPQMAASLSEAGFSIISATNAFALRLTYETFIRDRKAGASRFLIHATTGDLNEIPWDIVRSCRVAEFNIGELFKPLSPAAVRLAGNEHLDKLWDALPNIKEKQAIGETASFDFVLSHVYGIEATRLVEADYPWVVRFELFLSGITLPMKLARYAVGKMQGGPYWVELLVGDAAFLSRVQGDWEAFCNFIINGQDPKATLIPFTNQRLQVCMQILILNGAIRGFPVIDVPEALPSWMRPGLVHDEEQMAAIFRQRVGSLRTAIPGPSVAAKSWIAFAEKHAQLLSTFNSMEVNRADALKDEVEVVRRLADAAFFDWLALEYGNLSSNAVANSPYLVHQIAPHMLHLRNHGSTKQALIVVDGLALDQWVQLERDLKARRQDLDVESTCCFAWLPTLTEVSRHSIFAGCIPRLFQSKLPDMSSEERAWYRFWAHQGLADSDVQYYRSVGTPETVNSVLSEVNGSDAKIVGVVINTVDKMVHGTVLGKRHLLSSIKIWTDTGAWDRLVDGLILQGYELFVTADHGNVEGYGIGRPGEGSLPLEKSERVRVYNDERLRARARASMPETRTIRLGGLPPNYLPLFAPFDGAFIPRGQAVVSHGGTSIEEVMVPFAKIAVRRVV